MLDVQVKYLSYLEDVRTHKANEDISRYSAYEQGRHNLVTEDQGQQQINELIQHNRATEAAQYMQARAAQQNAETNRLAYQASLPLIAAQTEAQTASARQSYTGAALNTAKQWNEEAQMYLTQQKTRTEEANTLIKNKEADMYDTEAWARTLGHYIPF